MAMIGAEGRRRGLAPDKFVSGSDIPSVASSQQAPTVQGLLVNKDMHRPEGGPMLLCIALP